MRLHRIYVVFAVLGLLVAACSGGGGAASTGSAGAEPVTLTVMNWGNQGNQWWDAQFKAFEKLYPNVSFKQDIEPYASYADKLGQYRLAGSGPDVLQMSAGGFMLSFTDLMLPLNGLVPDVTQLYNGAQTACEDYDCSKTVYGLPWSLQGHVLYYNKAVLSQAGLDPANPPTTWREMAAACTKIEAIGKACIANGPKDYGALTEIMALMQQTATVQQVKDLVNGTAHGTDPEFVNAFALYQDMSKWFQPGVLDARLSPEAQNLFSSGGSGFFTGLLGDAYDWKPLAAVLGNNLGVISGISIQQNYPLPGVGPGPLSTSLDVSTATAFSVAKWTKHPVEAKAFVKFITSPAEAGATLQVGSFPSVKGFNSSSVDVEAFHELQTLVADSKGDAATILPAPTYAVLTAEGQLLISGGATPQQAGEALEKSIRP